MLSVGSVCSVCSAFSVGSAASAASAFSAASFGSVMSGGTSGEIMNEEASEEALRAAGALLILSGLAIALAARRRR
jgi:hypothetical protein